MSQSKLSKRPEFSIHLATNLESFFESEVQTASRKQGLSMSPYASQYLAKVLTKFAHSKNFLVENPNDAESGKSSFPTLAMMWLESLQTPPAEQYYRLQQLGDLALFTTGFFAEHMDRKMIDMDYYLAMGEQAYERAGRIRESITQEKVVNVFFELAASFDQYVEVFAELSDQNLLANDTEILKLYEKWLRTGSFRIQRMLGENGIIAASAAPQPPKGTTGPSGSQNQS